MDHSHVINWTELIFTGIFTLLGAAIGATLAGRHAINSVKEQLVYDQKTRENINIDDSLKVSYLYQSYLHSVIASLENLKQESGGQDIYSIQGAIFTKHLEKKVTLVSKDITKIIRELESVNLSNISYDYYKTYINSLEALRIIAMLLDRDTIVEDSGEKKGYFDLAVEKITIAETKIKENNQNLENELKNLEKYFEEISKK